MSRMPWKTIKKRFIKIHKYKFFYDKFEFFQWYQNQLLLAKSMEIFYKRPYHGDPRVYKNSDINKTVKQTFGFLYERTINREKFLSDAGFTVIFIWEKDFDCNLKDKNVI